MSDNDEFDVDVFIPTRKTLLGNLNCQVQAVLNSGVNARATVSIGDDSYPEFTDNLTPEQLNRVRVIPNVPQGSASICIKHCLENIEWAPWVLTVADDDCLLPWGLKHLWDAREGVSMVIGQTLGLSRERHLDFTAWKIGIGVTSCHVSTAMINMRSMATLRKPWMDLDPLSDFLMIKRMADNFPYRIIPSVVHVQAFAELDNLGSDFIRNFNSIYGHLL